MNGIMKKIAKLCCLHIGLAAVRTPALAAAAVATAGGVLFAAGSPAAADDFFASIEDLPLPAGFEELEADSFVFESPAGRIITAVARGTGAAANVRAFYARTLPPLGWEPRAPDRYQRDSEQLSFAYEPDGRSLIVRVRLVPETEE